MNSDLTPPYKIVIFKSIKSSDLDGYGEMAEQLNEQLKNTDGFLGMDSYSNSDNRFVTICYWRDEAAIRGWKNQAIHQSAQAKGKRQWYENYQVEVATVDRSYLMKS